MSKKRTSEYADRQIRYITPSGKRTLTGTNGKIYNDAFARVYRSLLKDTRFQKLTAVAQMCFICMLAESNGQSEFTFSRSAYKAYGISPTTFQRAKQQLIDNGFITADVYHTRRNIYRLSDGWKMRTLRG